MKTISLCLLAAGIAVSGCAAIYAGPIPAAPVYTNKTRFRIPYHYEKDELARINAREIRLLVSRDRGRTWHHIQTVAPTPGKFDFQTSGDGEYWFSVRTLDGRNRLQPEGATEPGLQVIVDTAPPTLQLNLRSPSRGKVLLVWNATDENLDPAQLRLEYLQPGADWQTIGTVPTAAGQFEWTSPQGGVVAVRGSIGDLAKNTVAAQTSVKVEPSQPGVSAPRGPEQRQPIAGPVVSPRENVALSMAKEFPGGAATATKNPPPSPRVARSDVPSPSSNPEPVESPRIRGSLVSHRPVDEQTNSAVRPTDTLAGARTGSVRRRVLNDRKFQIGYRLHGESGTGALAVDLYITDDGGATWYRYGPDSDKRSPVEVDVPRDGVYGFTLGFRDEARPATDAPQNGDPPSMEVVVDTVPPTIELGRTERGRAANASKLRLSWTYADGLPALRPIMLFYSPTGQAPWTPIVEEPLENTGSYTWSVGPEVPGRIFLRIEARDEAGNETASETPQPVYVNPPQSTARALGRNAGAKPSSPK